MELVKTKSCVLILYHRSEFMFIDTMNNNNNNNNNNELMQINYDSGCYKTIAGIHLHATPTPSPSYVMHINALKALDSNRCIKPYY